MNIDCAKCGEKLVDQRRKFCKDCDWGKFTKKLYGGSDSDESKPVENGEQ